MTAAAAVMRTVGHRDARGSRIAAWARHTGWKAALTVTGGVSVIGELPVRPCVVVANHNSHADTVALLATLPSRSRPVVAAAADYWGEGVWRAATCRWLASGFPVRRGGGGSRDLAEAAGPLRSGRCVIIFPEGTRSIDGRMGSFHAGAFRLARETGVPVVPVGIVGTGTLLPRGGGPNFAHVTVRIGTPLHDPTPEQAEAAVSALTVPFPGIPDSSWRRRAAEFSAGKTALVAVFAWAFWESLVWPLVPELLVAALVIASPRQWLRLAVTAVVGSVAGGVVALMLMRADVPLPQPMTTTTMYQVASHQIADEGAVALWHQPLSGIPLKVYSRAAGSAHVPLDEFVIAATVTRGGRLIAVAAAAAVVGAGGRRLRRFYPAVLVGGTTAFLLGLSRVVAAWS